MLSDGIVSFGTAAVTAAARNENAAPKMVFGSDTGATMCADGGSRSAGGS